MGHPSPAGTTRDFYDSLAGDYHLLFADWDAAVARQAAQLGAFVGSPGQDVLDCACGIGTQALGLAGLGHRVTATDLSPVAAARAAREAAARGLPLRTAAADMRRLPFPDASFDAVVCADNSLPHLLTAEDVRAALGEMRRVLRPGGLLLVSVRPYDALRADRPQSTLPQLHGDTVTFQLWHWRDDGERYDLEHIQLHRDTDPPLVTVRTASYWALTRGQLTSFAADCGFTDVRWHPQRPEGYYQPLLTARRRPPAAG